MQDKQAACDEAIEQAIKDYGLLRIFDSLTRACYDPETKRKNMIIAVLMDKLALTPEDMADLLQQ